MLAAKSDTESMTFVILGFGASARTNCLHECPSESKGYYIPQSYLRGFVDSVRWGLERPLWHLDVPNNVWSERSPSEVGYRYGFYDYATAEIGLETADDAFAVLESRYPRIRRTLIEHHFNNWKEHLDFLLCYAQMMRARSLLFFERQQAEWTKTRAWIVEEVLPEDGRSVKVKSMTPESLPAAFIRTRWCKGGTGKAEDAKLQDAGISLKQCPEK